MFGGWVLVLSVRGFRVQGVFARGERLKVLSWKLDGTCVCRPAAELRCAFLFLDCGLMSRGWGLRMCGFSVSGLWLDFQGLRFEDV